MDSDKTKATKTTTPDAAKTSSPAPEPKKAETNKPATTAKATPKFDKKLLIAIGMVVVAVAIVVAVIWVIASGAGHEDDQADVGSKGDASQVEDKESDSKELNKTLSVTGLSMKYSSDWKVDETGDDQSSIYKGNDYYIMLNHVDGLPKQFTTKEYAETFLSAFDDEDDYKVTEKPNVKKINGKDWYRASLYAESAWMTMYFYADGEDYYLATYGSTKSSKISDDVQAMLDTLTIKK